MCAEYNMTTEEELLESEVLWPEAHDHDVPASALGCSSLAPAAEVSEGHRPCSAGSRPVDIPRAARLPRGCDGQDDEDEGWGTMVPPHLMVSRRRPEGEGEGAAAAAAFSLRSGPGRGHRDLCHLRNSVLRMTGFIEG